MSLGKNKCRILKEIRQKIADENDIPYVTHACRFKGDCSGTCPRCESELRYLEKQLAARAAAGKRVAIAALCAGMTFGMAGCSSPFSSGGSDKNADSSGYIESTDSGGDVYVTTGEVALPRKSLNCQGTSRSRKIHRRPQRPSPRQAPQEAPKSSSSWEKWDLRR